MDTDNHDNVYMLLELDQMGGSAESRNSKSNRASVIRKEYGDYSACSRTCGGCGRKQRQVNCFYSDRPNHRV